MKRVNFFSGQQVQQEDLAYLQNTLGDEIKSRTSNQYSKGVISPEAEYVGVDTNQTLRIYPFRAYTNSGEQIVVPSDIRGLALDLTDDSNRQLGTQGFLEDSMFGWRQDTPYIIVARYMEEGARPRPHYRTREPFATRIYSGFKFFAMRDGIDPLEENGINPYIILAKAVYSNGKLTVTTKGVTEYAGLDATRMSVLVGSNTINVYDTSYPVTVSQHIRSIGDPTKVNEKNPHGITAEQLGLDINAVPEHERVFHASGFIGSASNVNSCFYTLVDARSLGVDFLAVSNLSSGDNLHFGGNTITSYLYSASPVYISLSDDSGIWPDGNYQLFINLKTRELGIATNIPSVVTDRKFSIIFDKEVKYTYSPISQASIDPSYQCILYTFSFKEEKSYTEIDLQGQGKNISNFITLTDNRVFGSISADNLQKNASGEFVVDFPIKLPQVKFSDGTVLDSANALPFGYIDKSMRIYYNSDNTIVIGSGRCKNSTNDIVMSLQSSITKKVFVPWSKGTNQGCVAPNLSVSSGTWHVFAISTQDGVVDVGIDTDLNASNLVNSNLTQESPIPGYRYYRRVGSIYIVYDSDTGTFKVLEFITIPDSSNGVTTVYTFSNSSPKKYISVSGSDTVLPVPSLFVGGTSPKYGVITVKMNISSPSDAVFREYLIKSETSPYGLSQFQHTLGVGDVEIFTFNGKVYFSNNNWVGSVVSYYDPRNV